MKAVRILARARPSCSCATRLDAQQYFGQNQVQYKHFKWKVIETEHFLVHYYPEERAAAVDAARMAERSYARLSRILDHQFREKKPIILFASRSDVRPEQRHRRSRRRHQRRHRSTPAPADPPVHRRSRQLRARARARDGARVPVRHLRARQGRRGLQNARSGRSAALVHGRNGGVPVDRSRAPAHRSVDA